MTIDIDTRLADIETRLAFQEQALNELSDALAAARSEEAQSALLLHRALEEVRQLRLTVSNTPNSADPALEPPPPHY